MCLTRYFYARQRNGAVTARIATDGSNARSLSWASDTIHAAPGIRRWGSAL